MKRLTTITAILSLFAALFISSADAAKENFDRSKPHVTITVKIGGVDFGSVSGINNLGVLTPTEEEARKRPGRTKYSNIVLKRGYTGSMDLQEWATKATTEGEDCKDCSRNISINILSRSGEIIRTFNLIDAFPVSWKVDTESDNTGSTATESLEIRVNRIEMA